MIIPAFSIEYSPLPFVKLQKIPSQNDFLNKNQEELLQDVWHSTVVRENGEKVDIYLLYSGLADAEFVAVFYFEDETPDDFEENYYYKNDVFILDVNPDLQSDVHLAISAERFGFQCVKNVADEDYFSYFLSGRM